MENLRNTLDLRSGQIICNGEEFMALPVALNERFSWVVCEWEHLSKITKDRIVMVYRLNPKFIDYIVVSRMYNLLSVEFYIHGEVAARAAMNVGTVLSSDLRLAEIKLTEDAI